MKRKFKPDDYNINICHLKPLNIRLPTEKTYKLEKQTIENEKTKH
jgi:hypothetical protein